MTVLVVIPTYNEVGNLLDLCSELLSLPLDLEILVIDDSSPDGTGEVAQKLKFQEDRFNVIHRKGKQGLGTAYIEGLTWALKNSKADIIAQMDADFSHNPSALLSLVEVATKGVVAVGSRYSVGGTTDGLGRARRYFSLLANSYIRFVLGLSIKDVTGAFRCWPRTALMRIELASMKASGFAILPEMLFLASCRGLEINEVPIRFNARRSGQSKLTIKIIIESLVNVWAIRWRKG